MKRKEARWTSSTTRLRDKITALENENAELKEEVRMLEKRRLELWQQRDQGSKPAATNVTSVTTASAATATNHVMPPHMQLKVMF